MSGEELQNVTWICWTSYKGEYVIPMSSSLQPLAHRGNVASLSLFYRYYFEQCSNEFSKRVPKPFGDARLTRYSDRQHPFIFELPNFKKEFYRNSFFPRTASLWNSLTLECFPLTYNPNLFKSNVNRHLLQLSLQVSGLKFSLKASHLRFSYFIHLYCSLHKVA